MYAYGVVLLELLTGRPAVDGSRPNGLPAAGAVAAALPVISHPPLGEPFTRPQALLSTSSLERRLILLSGP